MENTPIYSSSEPLTITAFRNRACAKKKIDPEFKQPTPQEIKTLRKLLGFTQVTLAKFLGVTYNVKKGSQTIRKWETSQDNKEYRPINYASWRLLLLAAGVITESDVQDEIEYCKTGSYTSGNE